MWNKKVNRIASGKSPAAEVTVNEISAVQNSPLTQLSTGGRKSHLPCAS